MPSSINICTIKEPVARFDPVIPVSIQDVVTAKDLVIVVTGLASVVVIVTFAEPSILAEPVTAPLRVIFLAVAHLVAVAELPVQVKALVAAPPADEDPA